MVANKEAEAAQLRGELQRMRNSSSSNSSKPQDSPAAEEDQKHVQQDPAAGTDTPNPAARQAVMDAAVAAKEKPTALVHQLQR